MISCHFSLRNKLIGLSLLTLPSLLSAGEVHEWGTFTTVSGSDGKVLSGLHWEEEQLPSFVHSHGGVNYAHSAYSTVFGFKFGAGKGMSYNYNLENVTVKMETPVLYFYGNEREKYNVKVKFKGGSISQWYPQRKSGDVFPKLVLDKVTQEFTTVDFAKPYNGHIEWNVETIPRNQADQALTFKFDQSLTWEYPRVTDANMLKVGEEYENYLFYRGIGNFEQPVKFSVDASDTLHIENKSKEPITFAFAFENIATEVEPNLHPQHPIAKLLMAAVPVEKRKKTQNLIRYKTFGNGIVAASTTKVSTSDWKVCDPKTWRTTIFRQIRDGLVSQGLTLAESDAMVKTWWKSYFEHDGLRVFWVVPQAELNKVLPIKIIPKPDKFVRVIVGRSDILRPNHEQKLVDKLKHGGLKGISKHRFFEPYVNRLRDLVPVPYYGELNEAVLTTQHFFVQSYSGAAREKAESYSHIKFQKDWVKKNKTDKKLQLVRAVYKTPGGKEEWKILNPTQLLIGEITYTWDKKNNLLVGQEPGGTGAHHVIQMPLLLK